MNKKQIEEIKEDYIVINKNWLYVLVLALTLSFLAFLFFYFGYLYGTDNCERDNLIEIKLIGHIEKDYKETNFTVEADMVCDLNTKMCGNDMYYQDGKGFYWLGLHNISGIHLEGRLTKEAGK